MQKKIGPIQANLKVSKFMLSYIKNSFSDKNHVECIQYCKKVKKTRSKAFKLIELTAVFFIERNQLSVDNTGWNICFSHQKILENEE